MSKQLLLFHNAVSAYFSGNQAALEENMEQFEAQVGKVELVNMYDELIFNFSDKKSCGIVDRTIANMTRLSYVAELIM